MVEAMINKKMDKAIEEIKTDTPDPMNTMLEKESRVEAIKKKQARERMTIDVPPINPGRLIFTHVLVIFSFELLLTIH